MLWTPSGNIVNDGLVLYLDAGIKGSYPGTGTTWTDLASTNNGILTNGPTYSNTNGGSIVLDGVNDYVNLGSLSLISSLNFSIEVWVNFDVLLSTGFYTLFSYGGYIAGGFLFQKAGQNGGVLRLAGNGTKFFDSSLTLTSTGIWKQIAVSVTNGTLNSFYVDGSQYGSVVSGGSGSFTLSNPKSIEIGRRTDTQNQYCDANFSIVRLYDRPLTAAEINQNFQVTRKRFGI